MGHSLTHVFHCGSVSHSKGVKMSQFGGNKSVFILGPAKDSSVSQPDPYLTLCMNLPYLLAFCAPLLPITLKSPSLCALILETENIFFLH